MQVGEEVGTRTEGAKVGRIEGSLVGAKLGRSVGRTEGGFVGAPVGLGDSCNVG